MLKTVLAMAAIVAALIFGLAYADAATAPNDVFRSAGASTVVTTGGLEAVGARIGG